MIEVEAVQKLAEQGLITMTANASGSLFILNYTQKTQFGWLWTDLILQCRGLIIHPNGEVVARPFAKFFNLEHYPLSDLPQEPFEVYEKMDGSLGILYYDEGWKIATRGAFESPQAQQATQMLHEQYATYVPSFEREKTYLFEIIYPGNRIVLDYGDRKSLVLLAIIDTQTGQEYALNTFDFPEKVKRHDGITDLARIQELEEEGKEGFVVKYASGFRVKVKFQEYVRLHKLYTQISPTVIWEYLRKGKSFDELLERVPDEFFDWIRKTKADLKSAYQKVFIEAKRSFESAPEFASRKEFADWAKEQEYGHLLFAFKDGKPDRVEYQIWKMLKPKEDKSFMDF